MREKKRSKNRGSVIVTVLSQVFLIFLSFLALFPFIWMVTSSLKGNAEIFAYPPKLLPELPKWENYVKAVVSVNFGRGFFNSMKLTVINAFGQVLTASMAGYSFAKLKFKGSDLIFAAFVGVMMIPYTVIVIPLFVMFNKAGLVNTHLGIILMTFGYMPMGVFMCRQFIKSLPDDLFDAALIDGASYGRIYFSVVLPLIKPAVASLAIFAFLWNWNSYFTPMIFLTSQEKYTVPLLLQMFKGKHSTDWALIMAASTISVFPSLIVYLFGQNYIIEGITITGMKA